MQENWFENWFNSPYYKLLYSHRNENEAAYFLDCLLDHLKPPLDAQMLDLACGMGRHSIYLADRGFDITGIDLSTTFIEEARNHEHDHLSFFVHDMRNLFRVNHYDYIFNFFTSFGYFEKDYDNYRVLNAVSKGLRENGLFVIDYLNIYKAQEEMIAEQTIERGDVVFDIKKETSDGFIRKHIQFKVEGKEFNYEENVRLISLADFENYFQKVGLTIQEVFGDYGLKSFNYQTSDRLILVAKQNA